MKNEEKIILRHEDSNLLLKTYNANGITLVALVVTIIVLLILAGVTITSLLGDDGIIAKAQRAADLTNAAIQQEQEEMNALLEEFNSIYNETGSDEELIEKIGAYPAPEPVVDYTVNEGDIVAIISFSGGDDLTYTSLEAAIEDSFDGDVIYLVRNYELQEDITIPAGVRLTIPSSGDYNDVDTPTYVDGGENATSAYVTLKSNATITVEGDLLVGGKVRVGEGGGQGLVSGEYGQIVLGDTGKIAVNGDLYANGYITGTGSIEVKSGGNVRQLAQLVDVPNNGANYIVGYDMMCNVYMSRNYYYQNILVTTTYEYGSHSYANIQYKTSFLGSDVYVNEAYFILIGGTSNDTNSFLQMLETNSKIIIEYNWMYDKQIISIEGSVNFNKYRIGNGISTGTTVGDIVTYPIGGNTIIKILNEGILNTNSRLEMLPGSAIIVEKGGKLEVAGGDIYIWDVQDFDSHYVNTGNDENGEGEWRRTIYGEVMGNKSGTTIKETSSARIIVRGTLNAVGNIYNSPNGDNVAIKREGTASTALEKGEEGTVELKELRDGTTIENVTFKGFAI